MLAFLQRFMGSSHSLNSFGYKGSYGVAKGLARYFGPRAVAGDCFFSFTVLADFSGCLGAVSIVIYST